MVTPAIRRKFEALVSAAFIDGYLSESEKEVLNQKAAALGIAPREVNDILFLGQQRKLSVSIPPTSLERDSLLEDLIEVVTSDGRVEAPEYHMLARFAETLKIPLPELRTRVNRRMQSRGETRVEPRKETVRNDQPRPQPPPAARRPEPPKPFAPAQGKPAATSAPPPPPAFESPKFSAEALPPLTPMAPMASPPPMMSPPGPIRYAESAILKDPKVGDLPPVTLQLLKQSVMFDTEPDCVANIGRTLGIPPSQAADIRAAIIAAYPDLKPAQTLTRPAPTPPRPVRR
jgi:uncharacterized tellurite resistance protein B-like protein